MQYVIYNKAMFGMRLGGFVEILTNSEKKYVYYEIWQNCILYRCYINVEKVSDLVLLHC